MRSPLLAAALALVLLLPAAAQDPPKKGNTVHEIEFRGNKTVNNEYLLRQLRLKPGMPFDKEALNRDYKRVVELGFFSDVVVATKQLPDAKVKLIYTLTENLIIGEITFVGFVNLSDADVRPQLHSITDRSYSEYFAVQDKRRIEQLYRAEGYQFAHVRLLKRQEQENRVQLRFRVDEGPRVTLEKIRFEGNLAFSAKELRKQMSLQESGWFWWDKEVYSESKLVSDLVALTRYYRSKGFLDVRIALSDVSYAPDKTSMSIDIAVYEGARYVVDNVAFLGNALFTDTELANRLKLGPGQIYDGETLAAGKRRIELLYGDNARIFAKVSIAKEYAAEGSQVSLVVHIVEGHRVFVERVEIGGNDKTRDDIIRRQLKLSPGDPFNASKVRTSRRRLLSLNYFRSVSFDIAEPESGSANARDLLVEVVEKPTGRIAFVAAVSSNGGASAGFQLTERNFDIKRLPTSWSDLVNGNGFRGAGQFFQISIVPGSQQTSASIRFVEPSVGGGPYSFGFRIGATGRTYESYDERRLELSLSTTRRFYNDQMIAGVALTPRRVNVSADSDAPDDVEDIDGSNSYVSLTLSWAWDRRNNRIVPSAGYHLGASLELAGGDFNYVKGTVRGSWFYTTHKARDGRPYVLKLSGRVGAGGDLPVIERYFAGGAGSVRGYEFRSVSPRQGEDDDVVGGDTLALLNIEYSIPLVEEYLRLVTFLDIGGAGGETRAGAGFGFRLRLPIFGPRPVAFDFAIPLNDDSDDDTQVFSFSLGRSF